MNRKGAWITVGVVFLGVALFGLANLFAQRGGDGRGGQGGPGGFGFGPGAGIGRFQVVSSSTSAIIILDTVTGDLFKADPARDVKPYRDRPRIDFGPPADRDGPARDRPRLEKDRDSPPPDKDFKTERKDDKKADDKPRPVDKDRP